MDGINFTGYASGFRRYNAETEPIAIYQVTASNNQEIQFGDQIFGSTPVSFNLWINLSSDSASITNSAGVSLSTAKFEVTSSYDSFPANYNSSIDYYTSSDHPNAQFSILNSIYKTSVRIEQSSFYTLFFDKSIATSTIVVHSSPTGGSSNSNAPSSGTTTTTGSGSTATTTTTNMNAFGAGTTVSVSPNTGNLPVGTSTSTQSYNGYTISRTVDVLPNGTVKTTETATFQTKSNSSNSLAAQRRKMMGIPENFSGAIDPIIAYPSFEISKKVSVESGRFYNLAVSPTSFDLDPYFYFMDSGKYKNDFGFVAKDGYEDSSDINVKKNPYVNNVRSMGMRGPMLLSGWGYDIAGLPVPNGEGQIVQTGVVNNKPVYGSDPSGVLKFNPKTPVSRNLWKTGPVDLRWHKNKCKWVGGHDVLEGILIQDLPAGPSGLAKMRIDRGLSQSTNEIVTVFNKDPSLTASSGAFCVAMEINYTWRPIYVGC